MSFKFYFYFFITSKFYIKYKLIQFFFNKYKDRYFIYFQDNAGVIVSNKGDMKGILPRFNNPSLKKSSIQSALNRLPSASVQFNYFNNQFCFFIKLIILFNKIIYKIVILF